MNDLNNIKNGVIVCDDDGDRIKTTLGNGITFWFLLAFHLFSHVYVHNSFVYFL